LSFLTSSGVCQCPSTWVPSLSVYGSIHFCPQAESGANKNPQIRTIMSFFITHPFMKIWTNIAAALPPQSKKGTYLRELNSDRFPFTMTYRIVEASLAANPLRLMRPSLPASAIIDCPGEIHDMIWIPEQDEVTGSSLNSATSIIWSG
jgi:hypothetical protein